MDAASTSKPSMRIVLDITRSGEGRLEGEIRTDAPSWGTPFSGVLEFLKVLEELFDNPSASPPTAPPTEKGIT